MSNIRIADQPDIPRLATTLARTFTAYPWTDWIVPAESHFRRLVALFALDLTELGLPGGEVWTTDDSVAGAVWLPPDFAWPSGNARARHNAATADLLGDHLARANAADALLAQHRPQVPHWNLATMGTHPDWQRQGLGSAVLAPVLARCDTDAVPAYTETSTTENVAFYRRQGFDVTAEVAMPEGGPPVWTMWRNPRP